MNIRDQAIEEILKLVQEREQVDELDGFTSKELTKKLGWGERKASDLIDSMLEDGSLECIRLTRLNRAGIMTKMVGYRLTAKAQDKAAAES